MDLPGGTPTFQPSCGAHGVSDRAFSQFGGRQAPSGTGRFPKRQNLCGVSGREGRPGPFPGSGHGGRSGRGGSGLRPAHVPGGPFPLSAGLRRELGARRELLCPTARLPPAGPCPCVWAVVTSASCIVLNHPPDTRVYVPGDRTELFVHLHHSPAACSGGTPILQRATLRSGGLAKPRRGPGGPAAGGLGFSTDCPQPSLEEGSPLLLPDSPGVPSASGME